MKMADKNRSLFRLVSMLLVAAALYCAFSAVGSGLRFWVSLGIVSLIGIAYLLLFIQTDKDTEELIKKASVTPPDDNSTVSRFFMNNCPVPALVIDETGRVLKKTTGANEIFPDMREGEMLEEATGMDMKSFDSEYNPDMHEFEWKHFRVKPFTAINTESAGKTYTLLCFTDTRETDSLKDEAEGSRNYVALLLIDEYDELFSSEKDSKKSEVVTKIDRIAERFIERRNGLLKKLSDDRYLAIISEAELRKMGEKDYLAFLEDMHNIHVSERAYVSLSVGIGRGGSNLRESEEIARDALNVSQKQGGGHVVIKKSKDDTAFASYGGAYSKAEVSSQSRVKLFSDSLRNYAEGADKIIVMGHSYSDMDAVGAAAGLGGALRAMGLMSYVFVNRDTTLAMPVVDRLFTNIRSEAAELFVSEEQALELMTENTLVIIVDTNSKHNIDGREIYAKASKVIYIDHHIQVKDPIDNIIDRHLDPDASSASEIVTEIIRYYNLKSKLSCYYADALLSGIALDTKNFVMKTGVRTFEAAAYLKELGADPVSVKLLFANSFEIDKLRSRLIESAENYNNYAITTLSKEGYRFAVQVSEEDVSEAAQSMIASGAEISPEELNNAAYRSALEKKTGNIKVAAAQAADQLLNTLNIKASFAVFMTDEASVKISARSYGTVSGGANVQDIIKRIGGGGHITMAAADIRDKSLEEVCEMLKNALDEYDRAMKPIE